MRKQIKRFSGEVGRKYDMFSSILSYRDKIQTKCVDILESRVKKESGVTKVLEIGFGTGITTFEILNRKLNIELISIDNQPNMLTQAKKKLKRFRNASFKLKKAEALNYLGAQDDNAFDIIISVFTLHNLNNTVRNDILRQIFRVLKPNGFFINGDKIANKNIRKHKADLIWQIKKFDNFLKFDRPDLKTEWIKHYEKDESSKIICSEKEYINYLKKLGFRTISLKKRYRLDAVYLATK